MRITNDELRITNKIKNGFTLMELLVVIALIGILVTIGVVSFQAAQSKTRDSRRRADMKVLQSAIEQYNSENNSSYPTDISQVDASYLPGGKPSDPKPLPYPTYAIGFDTAPLDGAPYWYCACATLESAGTGNAANGTCGSMSACVTDCNYYCVRNLQ